MNDLISRQAVDEIKELMTDINGDTVYAVRMSDIRQLPSVNPQEPSCPFYKIDDDGHGLCNNHRYMEDVLDKIRAEIEKPLRDERCYDTADAKAQYIALNWCIEIIDKYKAESDHKCHTCKHYTSGEYDGSCDSYICEHYSGWESEDKE